MGREPAVYVGGAKLRPGAEPELRKLLGARRTFDTRTADLADARAEYVAALRAARDAGWEPVALAATLGLTRQRIHVLLGE